MVCWEVIIDYNYKGMKVRKTRQTKIYKYGGKYRFSLLLHRNKLLIETNIAIVFFIIIRDHLLRRHAKVWEKVALLNSWYAQVCACQGISKFTFSVRTNSMMLYLYSENVVNRVVTTEFHTFSFIHQNNPLLLMRYSHCWCSLRYSSFSCNTDAVLY